MTEDLRLESLRTAELVKVFADLAVEMEKANIEARTARYKALFEQQMRVERELKGRDGDPGNYFTSASGRSLHYPALKQRCPFKCIGGGNDDPAGNRHPAFITGNLGQ